MQLPLIQICPTSRTTSNPNGQTGGVAIEQRHRFPSCRLEPMAPSDIVLCVRMQPCARCSITAVNRVMQISCIPALECACDPAPRQDRGVPAELILQHGPAGCTSVTSECQRSASWREEAFRAGSAAWRPTGRGNSQVADGDGWRCWLSVGFLHNAAGHLIWTAAV